VFETNMSCFIVFNPVSMNKDFEKLCLETVFSPDVMKIHRKKFAIRINSPMEAIHSLFV